MATSARSSPRFAITTLNFSATKFVFPLRRIPAVSTNRYSFPFLTTSVSTLSIVVPGIGDTIDRSSPAIRFNSVDFPTFGRPIIAISTAFVCFGLLLQRSAL